MFDTAHLPPSSFLFFALDTSCFKPNHYILSCLLRAQLLLSSRARVIQKLRESVACKVLLTKVLWIGQLRVLSTLGLFLEDGGRLVSVEIFSNKEALIQAVEMEVKEGPENLDKSWARKGRYCGASP